MLPLSSILFSVKVMGKLAQSLQFDEELIEPITIDGVLLSADHQPFQLIAPEELSKFSSLQPSTVHQCVKLPFPSADMFPSLLQYISQIFRCRPIENLHEIAAESQSPAEDVVMVHDSVRLQLHREQPDCYLSVTWPSTPALDTDVDALLALISSAQTDIGAAKRRFFLSLSLVL